MANYKPYPKVKDTPSRKTRKGERIKVFMFNKHLSRQERRDRRHAYAN